MSPKDYFWGTGRRKSSVARVRIMEGDGKISVNNNTFEKYFPITGHQQTILAPLKVTNSFKKYDIFVNVKGGGPTGQAGAVLLGIARALAKINPGTEKKLRENGHLTRDSRMKERKKYGKRKARASFQFSKR